MVTGARIDGDTAVAQMVITDAKALAAIRAGTRELSLGYNCKLDDHRYQVDITLDHLALVPAARCGATCRLRADAACPTCGGTMPDMNMSDTPAEESTEESAGCDCPDCPEGCDCPECMQNDKKKCDKCAEQKSDGGNLDSAQDLHANNSGATLASMQLDEALAALKTAEEALAAANERADAEKLRADEAAQKVIEVETAKTTAELAAHEASKEATATIEAARKDASDAQAIIEQMKLDAEAAAAKVRQDAEDQFSIRVKSRVSLETAANAVLGSAADRSAMSDKDIKLAVIKHVDNDDLADKPELFIDGAFEGAVKRHKNGAAALASVREVIETRKDNQPNHLSTEDAASAALRQSYSSAWMNSTKKDN